MEWSEEEDQRKSIPGRNDLRVFFPKPIWHLGPRLQNLHSLLNSTFIEYLFYAGMMLAPRDTVVSKK